MRWNSGANMKCGVSNCTDFCRGISGNGSLMIWISVDGRLPRLMSLESLEAVQVRMLKADCFFRLRIITKTVRTVSAKNRHVIVTIAIVSLTTRDLFS